MKSFIIFSVLLICCMYFAFAAPPQNTPGVQFLKYKNDDDFEAIQRQIIAQYDQLGGTSQFHQASATVVDPQHIRINL
ncbi:uncharacterized protein LOC131994872 [Stomoxys calcitrans]|uniref:uncharacterized protein LOC131994872 n=1 Tax=Stomoxys calcitrans TaxID=35570 RepID=UPI0027E2BEDA|nr:uncharacterized protein LOC131994872 [Stomoxys calcitrans]